MAEEFRIDVTIDPRAAQAGGKQVEKTLGRLETQAGTLRRALSGVFIGVSAGLIVKELVQMTDTLTGVRNRLRLVTDSTEELNSVQQDLFEIASRTRSSFEGTATIFSRVAVSAKELGKSNQELLGFTESLNQAIILSGASAQEASNGLIQLSQGLASGTLRGDELRSVLEQLPAVADVIAKGLGVTRGELRKMGEQGKISATAVLDAFAKARVELAEKFATTVPTIGQAFEVLKTRTLEMVGAFDQATGSSGAIAKAIILVSDNVEAAAAAAAVLGTAFVYLSITAIPGAAAAMGAFVTAAAPLVVVAGSVALITAELVELRDAANEISEAMGNRLQSATLTGFGQLGAQIQSAKKELVALQRIFDEGGGTNQDAAKRIEQVTARLNELTGETQRQLAAAALVDDQRARQNALTKEILKDLETERMLLGLSNEERRIQEEILKRSEALQAKGVDLSTKANAALRGEIEGSIRRNAQIAHRKEVLDGIIGPERDYLNAIADLNEHLALGTISQSRFNLEVAKLKVPASPFEEMAKALKEGNEELKIRAIANRIQREGMLIELELTRQGETITDDKRAAIAKLVVEQDLLTQALKKQSEIEAEREAFLDNTGAKHKADLDALRNQIDFTKELRAEESLLNELRLESGARIAEIDSRIVDLQIRALDASKSLGDGFATAVLKMKQEAEDLGAVGEQIANVFAEKATNALIEFARTGELNFKAFATSVLEEITAIIARLLIVKAISSLFGDVGGAAGNVALNAGRQFGGTVQPGQAPFPVGENGPELFVPNRTGTIVPNPKDQPRQGTTLNVQVVNVDDPAMVPQAIGNGLADDAILNVLSRNKDVLKQMTA